MTHALIVEDNADIQKLIKIYFKRAGAQTDIVSSCLQVIELATTGNYDFVLIDIEMPMFDGFDTLKMIRSKGCTTPLYAFTSNNTEEQIEEFLTQGFAGYVQKPIQPQRINELIELYTRDPNVDGLAPILLEDNPLKGDEDIAPLIKDFLERLPSTMAKMEFALERSDWESLSSFAHQLKGAAGGYGYQKLTDKAASIEDSIKKGHKDESKVLIQELKLYVSP